MNKVKKNKKGIVHHAFYTKSEKEGNRKNFYGLSRGSDLDKYEFEFDESGSLKEICVKKTKDRES